MSAVYSGNTAANNPDQTPPDIPCNIRFAKMLERDYVYVISDTEIRPDQALREVIGYLYEDILLDQECTRIVTTHLNEEGARVYRMYDLNWGKLGATLEPIALRTQANPAEFLETLLACSISVDTEE